MSYANRDTSCILQSSRTPLDDCPPYDPTLWGGKDCYFLTKLLSSPEIREELAERGWAGDLNPVVNRPRTLTGRAERKSAGSSSSLDTNPAYLAPSPPTIVERAKSLARAMLFFMGLIPDIAVGPSDHGGLASIGWFTNTVLGRFLWGVSAQGEGMLTDNTTLYPPLSVTPTDSLQERLETALGVGDTVAAAHIAAELARRRATIQRHASGQVSQNPPTTGAAASNFWSQ